jgi:hypothetical protein
MGLMLPENSLEVIRGTSKTLELVITDESGGVVDLTGARIVFSVKTSPGDPLPLIQKTTDHVAQVEITLPREGKARIYLQPSDTQTLEALQYVFDVWLILTSGKRFAVVPSSIFAVKPGVTLIPL